MILKDIHTECQRCENLKAWNIHMSGEHDYACRKHPMFISKDLHREPCEKFIAKVVDYVSNNQRYEDAQKL